MDPKQELTSVDIAALVTELGQYTGAKVDKTYRYGEDLLRFRMRDFDRGRLELLIEVGEQKRIHTADPDHVPDAPERPPNFAMMLRNRLSGADLVDVEQFEFDRIMILSFERGEEMTRIIVELFGEGNVAVVDSVGEVIQSLETVRLKSRTVAPGTQYEFPDSRVNPLQITYDRFTRLMDESDSDIVRTLATQLNLGGLYAEEVCARAGVEKAMQITNASDDAYRAVHDALESLGTQLRSGDFEPRVYTNDDDAVIDVTPFPLEERKRQNLDATARKTFNGALDVYFREVDRNPAAEESGKTRPDFESEIEKKQRIIEQQKGAIDDFEQRAEAERARAELLYGNYELIDNIIETIQAARAEDTSWEEIRETFAAGAERGIDAAAAVVNVDGAEAMVTVEIDDMRIPVDVDVGVEKNADQRYTEAKRIENKKEGALTAIENTREELESVKQRRDAWDRADEDPDNEPGGDNTDTTQGERTNADDPSRMAPTDDAWLSMTSIPLRTSDDWYEQFRWFHTSTGYLVVGGRNADQNETLVKKYLSKHDRFFHTEARGGPITILKASGPSEPAEPIELTAETRREAAQFAISYSSIWKEGRYADDAYVVTPDQVSKTPESGEYIEKGSFVIRGDRTYLRDVAAEVAIGLQCADETQVIGGPPSAIEDRVPTTIRVRPGRYAQNDAGKLVYREFRDRFNDESFVRKIASPDKIQEFLPPGGSDLVDE
ncbi:ribosome rescue protein RqcH [Haloquadratum walsbyi]|uniref:Archaeal Rqc2 homolog aRqcH n=1 Tax=Haloquadratum walsbyi J07HQW2 TaxID=1238425 RepID=U1PSV6_9EURY|nr:ribosome rescue protein RqcH [Haloquadratum walsbyi]ERG96862.1 MAG: putative eukaryotic snRNP-like RNA-binding protein [Haloquadratum walsbyi J07HQW2]